MFDFVNFKMNCPVCFKEVSDFQTRDTLCDMEYVDYWETDLFYSSCAYCNTWIEFKRIAKKPFVDIDNYAMKFSVSEIAESQIMRDKTGKITGYTGKKKSEGK